MDFSNLIRSRRLDLGLGVTELARRTVRKYVPSPVRSAVYISRIEHGDSPYMPVDSVTIDKLWGIGAVLGLNPMRLFLLSRGREDLVPVLDSFSIRSCHPCEFGTFVRSVRKRRGLCSRDAAQIPVEWQMSIPYWSQLEANTGGRSALVSGERLWGLGRALDIDPLLLYSLSRKLAVRYLKASTRDRLFS